MKNFVHTIRVGYFKRVKILLVRHKLLISIAGLLLLVILLGLYQTYNLKRSREAALAHFYSQQQQKKAELANVYENLIEEQRQKEAEEHKKAQELAEEVDKNFKPNLPDCSRLENRVNIIILSNSCDYKVKALGETSMAIVFVSEALNSSTNEAVKNLKNGNGTTSLSYMNSYLKKEAHRYGKSDIRMQFDFYGPYKITKSLEDLYYRDNMGTYLEVLSDTSNKNKVPEQNYDLVHYIYLSTSYGGGAFPSSHRAFTNSVGEQEIGVFIHETLHLFGTTDKYNDNDCNTIGRADPFDSTQKPQELFDIMCSLFPLENAIINTITAREIGWSN